MKPRLWCTLGRPEGGIRWSRTTLRLCKPFGGKRYLRGNVIKGTTMEKRGCVCRKGQRKIQPVLDSRYLPLKEQGKSCMKNTREGLVRRKMIRRWRQTVRVVVLLGTSITFRNHGDFELSILTPTATRSAASETKDEGEEQFASVQQR